MRFIHLKTLALLLITQQLHAQQNDPSSVFVDSAQMQAIRVYHAATGSNARIYTGMLQSNYSQQIEGRPYFDTSIYVPANITYCNLRYEHIPVLYDMYAQTLVTLLPSNIGVQLQPDKTTAFDIGRYRFIRLDSGNNFLPAAAPGFYEILHEGRQLSAYAHRRVVIDERITDRVERKFVVADKYYVRKNGQTQSFGSWRGLQKMLGLQRSKVRRRFRETGIDPKLKPDLAIRALLSYYDDQNPATP